jgi:hypothetical protein
MQFLRTTRLVIAADFRRDFRNIEPVRAGANSWEDKGALSH